MNYVDQMALSFQDELEKIAHEKVAKGGSFLLPAMIGGGLTYAGIQANKDRRLGRRLRMQQQQMG